jgi:hypothetical protein
MCPCTVRLFIWKEIWKQNVQNKITGPRVEDQNLDLSMSGHDLWRVSQRRADSTIYFWKSDSRTIKECHDKEKSFIPSAVLPSSLTVQVIYPETITAVFHLCSQKDTGMQSCVLLCQQSTQSGTGYLRSAYLIFVSSVRGAMTEVTPFWMRDPL